METFAAVLVCLLLAALAVFQVLLAAGLPLGRFAWGGNHDVLPTVLRIGSVVSILIYALIAVIVAARADLIRVGVPDPIVAGAAWIVTGYFFVGIAMNLASRSKPERVVMTPLCAVLCVLSGLVALS